MGTSEPQVEVKPKSLLSGTIGKLPVECYFFLSIVVKEDESDLAKVTELICRQKPDSRMEIAHSTKLDHNTKTH